MREGGGAGATAGAAWLAVHRRRKMENRRYSRTLTCFGEVRLEDFNLDAVRRKRAKERGEEGEGETENSRGKSRVSHSSTITCVNRACFGDGVGFG